MNLVATYLNIFFVLLVLILILTNASAFGQAVQAISKTNVDAINAFKTK